PGLKPERLELVAKEFNGFRFALAEGAAPLEFIRRERRNVLAERASVNRRKAGFQRVGSRAARCHEDEGDCGEKVFHGVGWPASLGGSSAFWREFRVPLLRAEYSALRRSPLPRPRSTHNPPRPTQA